MARSLAANKTKVSDQNWVPLPVDQVMPDPIMRAYLAYRLHILEAEIASEEESLEASNLSATGENSAWTWDRQQRSERRRSSLTKINYMVTAYHSLRRALRTMH